MEYRRGDPVYVTQPALPPLAEFQVYLERIWESKRLTNKGPLHEELEEELADFLGVRHVSLFANGTLALVCALQALRISGEVITTPFSFVATTHALHWNSVTPVFCDIRSDTMVLDAAKTVAHITPRTTAILPVHVYGHPCDVARIGEVADVYGLKVIYDACHAFGVRLGSESILNFGDLSVLSFHATKVFTTMEGGAIVSHDEKTKRRIDNLKNCGFAGETTVVAPGINAKMNEMQSALGLLQLRQFDGYVARRKALVQRYRDGLIGVPGITCLPDLPGVAHNYSYFPIRVDEKEYGRTRDELNEELKRHNIFGRRYFYPLISQFPTYKGLPSAGPGNLPVAERSAAQVLCLPLYPDLEASIVDHTVRVIREYGT